MGAPFSPVDFENIIRAVLLPLRTGSVCSLDEKQVEQHSIGQPRACPHMRMLADCIPDMGNCLQFHA
jgi:hypothetical protein